MEKFTTRYIPWVDQTPSQQYTFAEGLHPFVELYQDECIKSLFYRLFSQQQQWLNQSKRQAASHIQAKVPANHLENQWDQINDNYIPAPITIQDFLRFFLNDIWIISNTNSKKNIKLGINFDV